MPEVILLASWRVNLVWATSFEATGIVAIFKFFDFDLVKIQTVSWEITEKAEDVFDLVSA